MSNSPLGPPASDGSVRCAHCGTAYLAGSQHVCADEPTSALGPGGAAPAVPDAYAAPASDEPDALLGTTLSERYQIQARIGHGGMGVVYRARHTLLGRTVAVKVLAKHRSETDQRRFLQEARLASQIVHPNIVYISDFGVLDDARPYLVMEFIEGPTLGKILRKAEGHRLDVLRALRIAQQIAAGMQAVHDCGIVHRDLKPENIFVLPAGGEAAAKGGGGDDFIKIVDFGIAKDTRAAAGAEPDAAIPAQRPSAPNLRPPAGLRSATKPAEPTASQSDSGDSSGNSGGSGNQGLTRVGASIGTPRYMAPEQVDGVGIDARADQYALGCILYQLICGQLPFTAPSAMELLSLQMFEQAQSLRERFPQLDLPPSIDALVLRLLAKSKNDRFGSMRDLGTALQHEIELLSIQRGEKVAISSGLAAQLGGGRGTHVIVRGRKLPLWAVAAGGLGLVGMLSLVGIMSYRRLASEPSTLLPGELAKIEAAARKVLESDLQGTDAELRIGALKGLALTRDSAYLAALQGALGDASPAIQSRAAEALGQLGDRRAIAPLQEVLRKNPAASMQAAVAAALMQLGDGSGQSTLESMLTGTSEDARLRAVAILCQRGHERALALAGQQIASPALPEPLRLSLLGCLAQTGNETALSVLRQKMRGASGQEAMLAAARLAQQGQEEGRAYLRERVLKPGGEKLLAARFLAAPDEPQVGELFRQVLLDRRATPPSRLLASEGLGLCGQLLDVRLLFRHLGKDSAAPLQLHSATAIITLARSDPGTLSEQSLKWARAALSDGEWTVREAAVAVLADSSAGDAGPLLATLMADAHPAVRASTARALGRRRDESAVLVLRTGLGDREALVREASLRSLLQIERAVPEQAVARKTLEQGIGGWVKELVGSGSEVEKSLARSLLLRLGDRRQLSSLRELAKSSNAEVRQLLVQQLGREVEFVAGLLADAVFAVRFAAASKLAEAGDRRAIPVLREALTEAGADAVSAVVLLRQLGETATLPEGLLPKLFAGSAPARLALLDALEGLPQDDSGQVLLMLKRLARDVDAQVRKRTAEVAALLLVGPSGHPGLPILRLLTGDSDAAVRARAAALLAGVLRTAATTPGQATAGGAGPSEGRGAAAPESAAAGSAEPSAKRGRDADAGVTVAGEASPGSDKLSATQGTGFVIVEAPSLVQFQIDKGRWQNASKKPIPLSVGAHELASLAGNQTVQIGDGATLTVKLAESTIEKLFSAGLDAHEKRDLRKAQKLFEKASSLCNRERKHPQPCSELNQESQFHLGQIHEAADRPAEAVTAFQKVAGGSAAGRTGGARRNEAQAAVARLLPSLGQVVIPKKEGSRCQEVTLYMLPGTHLIDVEGTRQTVKVRAKETVRLGTCE
jgi:serine/threonine protein kinase/HEAT repeat protein